MTRRFRKRRRERYLARSESQARRNYRRRIERKRRAILQLGGACERCGLTLDDVKGRVEVFDFHHRDPATKRLHLAHSFLRSWKTLVAELALCALQCAICHRLTTVDNPAPGRGRPYASGAPPQPFLGASDPARGPTCELYHPSPWRARQRRHAASLEPRSECEPELPQLPFSNPA